MFSRIFRRNTNIQTQNPVEPQVQGSEITDATEIQASGGYGGDHVNNPTEMQPSGSKRNSLIDQRMVLYLNIVDLS